MMRARSPAVVDDILDCATSSHCSPMVSTSSSGTAGEEESMPFATVSSEIAGYFLASAFAAIDRIQREAAAPGVLLVGLAL